MGKILAFKKPAPKKQGLCQHGFHKWVIWKEKQFDVKEGKLVTVYICARCRIRKVKAL